MDGTTIRPNARQDKLLVQTVGDELVVYDQEQHRVHRLNRGAALIWQHCDGKTSISDMAVLLQRETNLPANEKVVWLALDRLNKARLLKDRVARPTDTVGITRREFLKQLGTLTGAALLFPVVQSIKAPTSAQVGSPAGRGGGEGVCTCKCLCASGETPTFSATSDEDCSKGCIDQCTPSEVVLSVCIGIS